jgi:hypothetical protein
MLRIPHCLDVQLTDGIKDVIYLWLYICSISAGLLSTLVSTAEIFYSIYKWNVLSIQCKKRFRRFNLVGEVDCKSLPLIDFYVLVLTPVRN